MFSVEMSAVINGPLSSTAEYTKGDERNGVGINQTVNLGVIGSIMLEHKVTAMLAQMGRLVPRIRECPTQISARTDKSFCGLIQPFQANERTKLP